MVNERFATQHFPNEEVIGKRIRLVTGGGPGRKPTPGPWLTIVGVTPTIRQGNPQSARTGRRRLSAVPHGIAGVHEHHHPEPGPGRDGDAHAFARRSRPSIPICPSSASRRWTSSSRTGTLAVSRVRHDVHDLRVHRARAVGGRNLRRHGLLGHAANAEIGVRMALGAQAGQVSWLILRRGLVQLAIGLTLGLVGGLVRSAACCKRWSSRSRRGSGDVRDDHRCPRRRHGRGVRDSRTARHAAGPAGRAKGGISSAVVSLALSPRWSLVEVCSNVAGLCSRKQRQGC